MHAAFPGKPLAMAILFASTIFLSSFLLFLVQPLIAKQILPWFGGAASVWTTCLLFFQALLLAGYAYAHASLSLLRPRVQAALHALLLLAAALALPVIVGSAWKPTGDEEPVLRILLLLGVTIGLPYFMLSSTGPLVQVWYFNTLKRVPYRLFSLSNIGSLLALVLYPAAIEPWVSTRAQAIVWSAGFALLVVLCASSAVLGSRRARLREVAAETGSTAPAPRARDYLRWMALAGLASYLLLAVSNHITLNVASIPFLWVLPLALYLLSFVLCFDHDGWYWPRVYRLLLVVALTGMAWLLDSLDLKIAIPSYLAGLFVVCMFCHGEIARQRPPTDYLTGYYLMISLGGVTGGLLVAVVAPLALHGVFELGIGIAGCALLALVRRAPGERWWRLVFVPALAYAGYCEYRQIENYGKGALLAERDFYGALRVVRETSGGRELISLRHGGIMHGAQWVEPPENSRRPITYYGPDSGLGVALAALRPDAPRRLGMVGLGAGTLAAYGKAGDAVRFYEVNPQVVAIAHTHFSYLRDTPARVEIAVADARLSLEREPPQRFDLLAIDAFSGDAIPTHLLSLEALDLYLQHIRPDGALLFHVTNRYLNLAPVVARIAAERGLRAMLISDGTSEDAGDDLYYSDSDWVIVTRNAALLAQPQIAEVATEIPVPRSTPLWTDDFNNLARALK